MEERELVGYDGSNSDHYSWPSMREQLQPYSVQSVNDSFLLEHSCHDYDTL